jgi:succinoglycan biosynthesis protein ExoA
MMNELGAPAAVTHRPLVSIIIPCRNESKYIGRCVRALLSGTYANIEVIVADGMSEDGTRELLSAFSQDDPRVRWISNDARVTPAALNIGIRAARGGLCAILGAHSLPAVDWVEKNVAALDAHPEAAAAGGVLETTGDNFIGRAIAAVMSSPFGVGNSRFRTNGSPGTADTVVFGCYRSDVFKRHGLFDEIFTTNQDDEFNIRLTAAGEKLYFEPSIRCQYFARISWQKLVGQYWRYGRYKVDIFRKNRKIGSLRQLAPGAWVTFLAAYSIGGALVPAIRPAGWTVIGLYVLLGSAFMLRSVRRCGAAAVLFVPLAASIHLAYGVGTCWGAIRSIRRNQN